MTIEEHIQTIRKAIHQAEAAFKRTPDSVRLLAVSKGHSLSDIQQAYDAGLFDFGESYLQEALAKINQLSHLPICWHFIGPIQSNKAKDIARNFSWVHSLDRLKVARILNSERPASSPLLNICLQINFDDKNKSGISPKQAPELLSEILALPQLNPRGLMIIPKSSQNEEEQYAGFLRLAHLLESLNKQFNLQMDTLSMGMSNDFKAAIRAGSTMVRIGTALFGTRS